MLKYRIINKICLFLIIFLTSSFAVVNDIVSTSLMILSWVIVLFLLLIQTKVLNKKQVGLIAILLLCIWCTVIFNQENVIIALKLSFAFISIFFYSNIVNYDIFKTDYIKIMFFICIISLIGLFVFTLIPSLQQYFFYNNKNGIPYSCLFLYVHPHNYFRNYGLFWEPGAFQTFIGLALLFEFTQIKNDYSKFKILVFIVSMIVTFSTTGYFVLAILFLLNFIKKESGLKMKISVTLILSFIITFMYFNQNLFFSTNTNSPFGKLINSFGNGFLYDSTIKNSTTIRINSIIYPFIEYLKHPLFGCGYNGLNNLTYKYTYNMNTCTFINWFAVYGTLFGLIMVSGFYKLAKKISNNFLELFTILLIFLLLIISENYVNNAFFLLLTLYGFRDYKEN